MHASWLSTSLLASLLALLPSSASAAPAQGTTATSAGHHGPGVPGGEGGPQRFVELLYENFVASRAMRDAAYADQWYRTPGAPSYDATLDRMEARLREHGFGSDPRLKLRILEQEMASPAWIPRSASLILRVEGHPPQVLHAFSHPSDHDRVMLPVNTPSADVEGRAVFSLDEIEAGTVLVTEAKATRSIIRRAQKRGAVAVLSSSLFVFTVDPTGQDRHLDAILWTKVDVGTKMPVAYISPRVHQRIAAAASAEGATAWLTYVADVTHGGKTLRTLVAEVVGSELPEQAVAIASHVQEPGAGDNASGIAGLTESACVLADLVRKGKLPWPKRSLAFLWGDEKRQSRSWLAEERYEVVAGISADMLGQSRSETGAMPLLERGKDPGAIVTIEPDSHTPWGAGEVVEEDLVPNGLSVIARAALVDVAHHVGGWHTSENPWEGGSDHDVFIEHGAPGVLMWHFTDFTYHTSLDRMTMLDAEELRRTCTAVLSAALAVADAGPQDLERYLAANELERELRVGAARGAMKVENSDAWEAWCDGAAAWLKRLCRE